MGLSGSTFQGMREEQAFAENSESDLLYIMTEQEYEDDLKAKYGDGAKYLMMLENGETAKIKDLDNLFTCADE